jgi:apolipoprotein N-acyltransferase
MMLALVSGALLWASFYPLNFGWLGWIALVPFLGLVKAEARPRRVYGAALLCGLAFFVPVLQWMRVGDKAMYGAWLALALYCSLYFPVALLCLRYLNQRTTLPLFITLPVVWTAFEFLRAHLISGFPWYFLAHTQHELLPMIQISDLAGAYGLSALMAAGNAVVFEMLLQWEWFRQLIEPGRPPELSRVNLRVQASVVLASFGVCLVYGFLRIEHANFRTGPRVLLIQSNVPQQIRDEAWSNQGNTAVDVMSRYVELTESGLKDKPKPDLIVWPESSLPEVWIQLAQGFPHHLYPNAAAVADRTHAKATKLAQGWGADFLVGGTFADVEDIDHETRFNSSLLIRREGKFDGRYDKIHLVPFGEFLPFRKQFKWMKFFSPYDYEYSVDPGTSLKRFKLANDTFGVLICYEDTDPTLARQYAHAGPDGPAANFLVNVSNDGWFDGTSEHEQHLATCRFRAVETRRAIARSVNMGVSAVIDGNGKIIALPGETVPGSVKMEGFISCNVPIDDRTSYYGRFGDWLPWTCWVLLGAACLWGHFRPVTSSSRA